MCAYTQNCKKIECPDCGNDLTGQLVDLCMACGSKAYQPKPEEVAVEEVPVNETVTNE